MASRSGPFASRVNINSDNRSGTNGAPPGPPERSGTTELIIAPSCMLAQQGSSFPSPCQTWSRSPAACAALGRSRWHNPRKGSSSSARIASTTTARRLFWRGSSPLVFTAFSTAEGLRRVVAILALSPTVELIQIKTKGSNWTPGAAEGWIRLYSTVTDFARFRGLSTSLPRSSAA